MLEVLGESNCSLAQLMREQMNWGGRWGSTRLMERRSRSDCAAKAQCKTTDLLYKSPVVPHKDCVELTLADLL